MTLRARAGLVYHWPFFSAINPAARLFAVLVVAQALLLWRLGWQRRRLRFRWRGNLPGGLAASLIALALIVYPLLNRALGHAFTESPTFGLPCPTTIFTFRLFWLAEPTFPRFLLIIPLVWSVVGGSAAFLLEVPQDFGLLAAGLLSLPLLKSRN